MTDADSKRLDVVLESTESAKRLFEKFKTIDEPKMLRLHPQFVLMITACDFLIDNLRVIRTVLSV